MPTAVCISFSFALVPWQIVRNVMMATAQTILMIIVGLELLQLRSRLVVHMTTAKVVMGKGGFDADSTRHLLHMMCMRVRG